MAQLSWEYRLAAFFLALSFILLLLFAGEWWYGNNFRDEIMRDIFTVDKAGFEMQPVPVYPFVQQPVEAYAEFVQRPIFFEGRRPIAKAVAAPTAVAPVAVKPPVEDFDLLLTGILDTPKGIRVMFQNPKATTYSDKFKKLTKGDEVNGWKLIEIKTDKVTMQADDQTKEVLLLKAKSKQLPPTAPPPPPPAAVNPFAIQPPPPPQPKR